MLFTKTCWIRKKRKHRVLITLKPRWETLNACTTIMLVEAGIMILGTRHPLETRRIESPMKLVAREPVIQALAWSKFKSERAWSKKVWIFIEWPRAWVLRKIVHRLIGNSCLNLRETYNRWTWVKATPSLCQARTSHSHRYCQRLSSMEEAPDKGIEIQNSLLTLTRIIRKNRQYSPYIRILFQKAKSGVSQIQINSARSLSQSKKSMNNRTITNPSSTQMEGVRSRSLESWTVRSPLEIRARPNSKTQLPDTKLMLWTKWVPTSKSTHYRTSVN